MNILTVLPVKSIIRNEGDDIFSHNKNKTTSSNADKLQSVLTLVQTLADSQNIRERQVIFYIIKMYADKINVNQSIRLIEIGDNETPDVYNNLPSTKSQLLKLTDLNLHELKIDLGKHPVISQVWRTKRLIQSLGSIGHSSDQHEWKEDKFNHFYKFVLPIGVTFATNGHHSIDSGVIKAEGQLIINNNSENTEIIDISNQYDVFWFDGDCFRSKYDNSIVSQPSFESGCLFEIRRIVQEHNISFLGFFS